MDKDKTLIILKPSGVPHFDEAELKIKSIGLDVADEQLLLLTEEQVRTHYKKYVEKTFFPKMLEMMSHPVWPILVRGKDAINKIRKEFMPGFREAYGVDKTDNACHCSDPNEDPAEEVARFQAIIEAWRAKHKMH